MKRNSLPLCRQRPGPSLFPRWRLERDIRAAAPPSIFLPESLQHHPESLQSHQQESSRRNPFERPSRCRRGRARHPSPAHTWVSTHPIQIRPAPTGEARAHAAHRGAHPDPAGAHRAHRPTHRPAPAGAHRAHAAAAHRGAEGGPRAEGGAREVHPGAAARAAAARVPEPAAAPTSTSRWVGLAEAAAAGQARARARLQEVRAAPAAGSRRPAYSRCSPNPRRRNSRASRPRRNATRTSAR